jgi:uncharacterized membrane protein YdjX (TVP38/TMEM64 family)
LKRYVLVATGIATLVLISFLIVEAVGVPLLTDPSGDIRSGGVAAALLGGGLLLADVFIPIPSSVIMIAHGAAFGVLGGFLLSLAASVGGAMIGWWVGRAGSGWWVGRAGSGWMDRIVSTDEKRQANAFITRYGLMAIIISRLLPIVAETVAVMSGTTDLGWRRVLVATTIGSMPPALIYAIAGSVATDFASGALVAAAVFVLAGVAWLVGRRLVPGNPSTTSPAGQAIVD